MEQVSSKERNIS